MDEQYQRRRYWIRWVMVCLFAVGIYFIIYGYTQAHYTATIRAVGEATYKKSHSRRRSRSSGYYQTTLTVAYADAEGTEQTEKLTFKYKAKWNSPQVGQQLEVAEGLFGGVVTYPSYYKRLFGALLAIGAGVSLVVSWLVAAGEKRDAEAPPAPPDKDALAWNIPVSESMYGFPDRVTRMGSGVYRWRCQTDQEYENSAYKITLIVCGALGLFILAFGAFLSIRFGDWSSMRVVGLCVIVFMAITFLVCWGHKRLQGGIQEYYEMSNAYIKVGTPKRGTAYWFDNMKQVTIKENAIEIKGRLISSQIFIPPDDRAFVENYILSKLPVTAEVLRP